MAHKSNIEWTDATWNPVTGCSKVSDGCKHCYAERMAKRLQKMGVDRYRDGFAVRTHEEVVAEMYTSKWKSDQRVFVCSMSDLFHESVPDHFIAEVFDAMIYRKDITFILLTKRSSLMKRFINGNIVKYSDFHKNKLPDHIWVGVSVEDQATANVRLSYLLDTAASVKWLSVEPLLGEVSLEFAMLKHIHNTGNIKPYLEHKLIDWVVVGGESGPGARPMHPDWVRRLRDECNDAGVPFFFKQWGGVNKKKNGRQIDSVEWNQFPIIERDNVTA